MREALQRVLDFAIDEEKGAEALYRAWASRMVCPAVVSLFAELAAIEHGHVEMLLRLTPDDLLSGASTEASHLGPPDVPSEGEASAPTSVREAMAAAMKREETVADLFDAVARLGGETRPLFVGLAAEERRHRRRLEAACDALIVTET